MTVNESILVNAKGWRDRFINRLDKEGRSVQSMSNEISKATQQAEAIYTESVKGDELLDTTDDVKVGLANDSYNQSYSDVHEKERTIGWLVDDYTLVIGELEIAIESVDNPQEKAVLRGYIKDIEDREVYWMETENQA